MRFGFDLEEKRPYPKAAFLIIVNEFCERYSYYGLRTILTLYLVHVLKFSEDTTTVISHATTMATYLTPLLGAIIADSFIGKFKTIFYFSIIHALGNIVVALAATPPLHLPAIPTTMLGLGLTALGTGGIKPCVSSFGGDQFLLPQQYQEVVTFFSYFYAAINLGAVASSLLTPILRSEVQCFGDDTCYSLAFAVPAGLMIVALGVFVAGKSTYREIKPSGNVVVKVVQCITHALSKKSKSPHKHWLDHADDEYDPCFIEDVKAVYHLLAIYLPLPLFWALFDQMASTWTLQATRMNGVVGSYTIYPDQFMVVNPIMILIFIPLFDRVVYPALEKWHCLKTPLQRMTFGGVLCAVSFIVSGVVEVELEKTYPNKLTSDQVNLNFINTLPCAVTLTLDQTHIQVDPGSSSTFQAVTAGSFYLYNEINQDLSDWTNKIRVKVEESCPTTYTMPKPIEFSAKKSSDELAEEMGTDAGDKGGSFSFMMTFNTKNEIGLAYGPRSDDREKPNDGKPKLRLLLGAETFRANEVSLGKITVFMENDRSSKEFELNRPIFTEASTNVGFGSKTLQVDPVPQTLRIVYETAEKIQTVVRFNTQMHFKSGGSYVLAISQNGDDPKSPASYTVTQHVITSPNTVHMLWLLPQYVIITLAEILFVVTGLQFSYDQAPVSMKAVMQSAWCFTVAVGNLFVVIIAEAKFFENQSTTFFMYAVLMFADIAWFAILACQYVPAKFDRPCDEYEYE